jgi:peroxiredoxin
MKSDQLQDLTLGRGARLPELTLPSAAGGAEIALRAPGRRAPVVVQVDEAECEACDDFLTRLAAEKEEIAEWDGRVVVVVPGEAAAAARLQERLALPFPVLADPDHRLSARIGTDAASVLVADQWGEIHMSERIGVGATPPTAAEIVEWLRYLAIQCPECQGEAL